MVIRDRIQMYLPVSQVISSSKQWKSWRKAEAWIQTRPHNSTPSFMHQSYSFLQDLMLLLTNTRRKRGNFRKWSKKIVKLYLSFIQPWQGYRCDSFLYLQVSISDAPPAVLLSSLLLNHALNGLVSSTSPHFQTQAPLSEKNQVRPRLWASFAFGLVSHHSPFSFLVRRLQQLFVW